MTRKEFFIYEANVKMVRELESFNSFQLMNILEEHTELTSERNDMTDIQISDDDEHESIITFTGEVELFHEWEEVEEWVDSERGEGYYSIYKQPTNIENIVESFSGILTAELDGHIVKARFDSADEKPTIIWE